MPLETINYLPDLNTANPTTADGLVQGDDHLRGIKLALRNTFPNFTAASLASSQAEIDLLASTKQITAQDGSLALPSITFNVDNTTGFYRSSSGHTGITGRLSGNGAVPTGAIFYFAKPPPNMASGGVVTPGVKYEYLELDGSAYNVADFPDLGNWLGVLYGGTGSTFALPRLTDTGRFIRSRTATLPYGGSQPNAFLSHTHTGTTSTAGAHSHTATVTDPGHTHAYIAPTSANTAVAQAGSSFLNSSSSLSTGSATTGITVALDTQGSHGHTFTTNVGSDSGSTETRPESFVAIAVIKT